MFFNIGFDALDNFPFKHRHNNLVINLDAGWKQTVDRYNNSLHYKGYLDNFPIEDKLHEIAEQEEPRPLDQAFRDRKGEPKEDVNEANDPTFSKNMYLGR